MARAINARQREVLQWIADGCPAGRWAADDNGHKVSAAALKSRGLVTVKGHGPAWSASVTEVGTHYLEHGAYPPGHVVRQATRKKVAATAEPIAFGDGATNTLEEARTLVRHIQDQGGTITVADPAESTRGRYRRLLHACREHHLVPAGLELRFTGRDSGDITIALTDGSSEATSDWLRIRTRARKVTTNLEALQTALETSPVLDRVSEDLRPRAIDVLLRLAEALRDYDLKLGVDIKLKTPKLFLQVETRRRDVTLSELMNEVAHVATPAEERETRRQPWKTVPQFDEKPSGNLRLAVARDGWNTPDDEWRDAPKSRLESRVTTIARKIKAGVVDDEDARARAAQAQAEAIEKHERQRAEGRRAWEELRDRATVNAAEHLRRTVFSDVYDAWTAASEIRRFCDALEASAAEGDGRRSTLRRWVDWARDRADQIDPAIHLDRLDAIDFDITPTDDDLAPFMDGWRTDGPYRNYASPPAHQAPVPQPRPWHPGLRGKAAWWR